MFPLILLLLALFTVATCPANYDSLNPLAGLEGFTNGFDATTLTDPVDSIPLFAWTYKQCKTFTAAGTTTTWKVPDQLAVSTYSHSYTESDTSLSMTYEQYFNSILEGFNVNVGINYDGASASIGFNHEIGKTHYEMTQKNRFTGLGKVERTIYSAESLPSFMLTPSSEFTMMMNALPDTITTSQDLNRWTQVVERLGTHYAWKGLGGGYSRLYSFMNQSLKDTKSTSWVYNQLSLQFSWEFIKINGGYHGNRSNIHISKDFTKDSTQSLTFLGGNPALQTNATIGEWFKSVVTYPELFNGSYSPIASLITDATKASTYTNFVSYYMSHGCYPVEPSMKTACKIPKPPASSEKTAVMPPSPPRTTGIQPQAQGVDVLSKGYNAATGASTLDILQYSYNLGRTWTDSEYGVTYRVPDEVILQSIPQTFLMNESSIFVDSVDWQMRQTHWSFSGGFFYSKSSQTTTFNERYYQKDQAMALNQRYYSTYRLTQPDFEMSSMVTDTFKSAVDALPSYDSTTQKEYFEFIEAFGTHVPIQIVMGGQLTCETWFHRCFLNVTSEKWVSKQSGFSFFGLISHGSQKQSFNEKMNKNFVEWSDSVFTLVGGDVNTPSDDWQSWVKSIHSNMAPLKYQFMSLASLVSDSEKSADLSKAIDAYVMAQQHLANLEAKALAQKDPHTMPSWCHGY